MTSIVVYANSAAPRYDPTTGMIQFRDDTGIALESEIINLYMMTQDYESKYDILYSLRNTTNKPIDIE